MLLCFNKCTLVRGCVLNFIFSFTLLTMPAHHDLYTYLISWSKSSAFELHTTWSSSTLARLTHNLCIMFSLSQQNDHKPMHKMSVISIIDGLPSKTLLKISKWLSMATSLFNLGTQKSMSNLGGSRRPTQAQASGECPYDRLYASLHIVWQFFDYQCMLSIFSLGKIKNTKVRNWIIANFNVYFYLGCRIRWSIFIHLSTSYITRFGVNVLDILKINLGVGADIIFVHFLSVSFVYLKYTPS